MDKRRHRPRFVPVDEHHGRQLAHVRMLGTALTYGPVKTVTEEVLRPFLAVGMYEIERPDAGFVIVKINRERTWHYRFLIADLATTAYLNGLDEITSVYAGI